MALLEGFYTSQSPKESEGKYQSRVILNANHPIFEGHFPGNPITPGVCMLQIVKALTEEILGENLFLSSANNVKFMAIINPNTHPEVDITIEINKDNPEEIKVKATATTQETTALKMSLQYKIL